MGKQVLVLECVAGPVNVDWKKLAVADPDIGEAHMHIVAGKLGMNGLPLVVKCIDSDCDWDAVVLDDVEAANN